QFATFLVQFNFCYDNTFEDVVVDVNLPNKSVIWCVMSVFLQMPIMAHRTQHLFCIGDWDFVLEFGAHKAGLPSFDRDSRFVACNSHAHLLTVGSRNEPVAYTDAVGYQLL